LAKEDSLRHEGGTPSLAGELTTEDPRGNEHNTRDIEVVAAVVGVNVKGGATFADPLELFRPAKPTDDLGGLNAPRDRDEVCQIGAQRSKCHILLGHDNRLDAAIVGEVSQDKGKHPGLASPEDAVDNEVRSPCDRRSVEPEDNSRKMMVRRIEGINECVVQPWGSITLLAEAETLGERAHDGN
jgi:hypothetical protein